MSITELSVRRPVTTMMVFVSRVVVGLIATRLVPLEYMPDISFPGAFVNVPYPNASPDEVEEQVIKPMEEALATISGLEGINSNAGENGGGVVVLFKQGTDIHMKAIEVKEKIESVRNQLPDDFEYYDISADYFNPFGAEDYNTIKRRVKQSLHEKIEASGLLSNAEPRLITELHQLLILTQSMGWTLQYQEEPLSDLEGLQQFLD